MESGGFDLVKTMGVTGYTIVCFSTTSMVIALDLILRVYFVNSEIALMFIRCTRPFLRTIESSSHQGRFYSVSISRN